MKILHLFDLAGVSHEIGAISRKQGHQTKVIDYYDPCNYREYYPEGSIHISQAPIVFLLLCFLHILWFRPKILHIHSNYNFMKIFLRFKRILPYKFVVCHFHGSELRITGLPAYIERKANFLIVSTSDLLIFSPKLHYMPNPIPQFLNHNGKKTKLAGFVRTRPKDQLDEAQMYARENGLQLKYLDIFDSYTSIFLSYRDMIEWLSECEYYLDFKGLSVMSKTAYESLQLGTIVIKQDRSKIYPRDIDFKKITSQWKQFYSQFS